MAHWWLYGGYVFPVVVKPENWTFSVKFDFEGQDHCPQNKRDFYQDYLYIWSKFGDPSLNGR